MIIKTKVLSTAVALSLFSLATLMPTTAKADVILLYNTGVDSTHTPLLNGAIDPHFTLVSSGDFSVTVPGPGYAATSAGGFPISPWLGDDPFSDWISPTNPASTGVGFGDFDYQTTFDLTGLDPTTAQITGQWATDNAGMDILINGVSTGQTVNYGTGEGDYSFEHWTPFSLTSGFVSGINTIDFVFNNAGGPAGLRVEQTGTAAPVPEPSQTAALSIGVLGLGILAIRMRRRSIS